MATKPLWTDGSVKIFGNNHDVPIIYGYQLSDKWKKEFDYYDNEEELDGATFFKYKGWIFDLCEFIAIRGNHPFEECPIKFDGYKSDTFFSGVLIKLSDDGESVKVYTYYS